MTTTPDPAGDALAHMLRLHDAVGRSSDPSGVYEAALDALSGALHVERASILLLDRAGVMRFQAWRGLSDRYRAAVEGHTPWRVDEPDPQPVLVPDTETSLDLAPHRELFLSEKIRSLAFVPLRFADRLLGKFMLYRPDPHAFTATEIAIASTIAGHVAYAIERLRVESALQEAIQARDEMVAMVSHDLRGPLATVLAACSLVDRTMPGDRHIGAIRRAGERMEHMLRDLLDVARIEAGQLPLVYGTVEIGSLVEEIRTLLGPTAEQRQVTVSSRIGGTLNVEGDRERLVRVLSNLVGNAIKFASRGGHVAMAADVEGNGVRVSISDDGPGIPEELLPRVFDRFWQAKNGRSEGSGLGLTIARGIVEAHGGTIRAASSEAGATFSFWLPERAVPRLEAG